MRARTVLLLLLWAAPALPQCSMCREAARSQRERAVSALNAGILLLAAPPAAILALLGRRIWRRRAGLE
mgnify:CR=1 FL=1